MLNEISWKELVHPEFYYLLSEKAAFSRCYMLQIISEPSVFIGVQKPEKH